MALMVQVHLYIWQLKILSASLRHVSFDHILTSKCESRAKYMLPLVIQWKLPSHSLLEIDIIFAVLSELFLDWKDPFLHDRVLFVVPHIMTYVRCLKSRAREMARLPASRMVCQPKWLFPNYLFLRFKCLESKMSDLLCLCLWKRLIWKRQKEAITGCQGECSQNLVVILLS